MDFSPTTNQSDRAAKRLEAIQHGVEQHGVDVSLPRPTSSAVIRRRLILGLAVVIAVVISTQSGVWGSASENTPNGAQDRIPDNTGQPSSGLFGQDDPPARSFDADLEAGPDDRAVAIAVPLAPLALETGDIIDLVTVRADGTGGVVTELLAEPVRVLAVDDHAVTVLASTTTATQIVGFQASGSIEMLLRLD